MSDNKYYPSKIEQKWQNEWEASGIFSPDVDEAKNPYYNLMMFPYPSAEGLHVGNMYAFTGADVYAKFQRMQGKDVLEPIGLDGFGIHSENYALKIGKHPLAQSEIAEKNFYRQLRSIGNSFDWQRTVETYNPNYYKWTQWLFIQMFKNGLAYRDTALVNWCPSCKTVLSDEQVLQKSKVGGEINKLQIEIGECERCGTVVEKKDLEQWFFRITKYAERLLNNIEDLKWSEKVKIAQKNWIGKSEGAQIKFSIFNFQFSVDVFTTRPDTLYGATFMVVAPEHSLVEAISNSQFSISNEVQDEVREYVEKTKAKTEIERTAEGKAKNGVFSGLYAINPVNGEKIPVWIADYVLSGYGTGAIMAVPAHDERDYAFAKKYGLNIVQVIEPQQDRGPATVHPRSTASLNDDSLGRSTGDPRFVSPLTSAYVGPGRLINSGEWDGFEVPQDMDKVLRWLEEKGLGVRKANYHLRDWLISRQRYWGPPIPMIFCGDCASQGRSWFTTEEGKAEIESRIMNQELREKDHDSSLMLHNSDARSASGWYPVLENALPVELPDVADWKPMGTGKSPLANHPEFYKTTCPSCGGEAKRETDVSDTFLDSAWYFLRYPSVKISNIKSQISNDISKGKEIDQKLKIENSKLEIPWDPEVTRRWLPVDQYIGGAEHSVLHLLYSRFVTMVLHDLKYIDFEEPFTNFFAHGLIIKDGAKMSKSKGNVVVPDEYINKYGADTLRSYLMFIGPYSDGGDFRDTGIEGMNRFIRRVWNLMVRVLSQAQDESRDVVSNKYQVSSELDKEMHIAIKRVTEDIGSFSYNTAIARIMEYYNALNKHYAEYKILDTKYCKSLLLLLAPFAPHMTEELYQRLKTKDLGPTNEIEKSMGEKDHKSSIINHQSFTSIHLSKWPQFEEKYLVSDTVTIVVQVNGKRRAEIEVGSQDLGVRNLVEEKAKEAVSRYLEGVRVKKVIYVQGKIINFVI